MGGPSLPEQAIVAFERATGLHVVFHGFGGPLVAALPPERCWHTGSLCRAVKHVRLAACMAFDVELAHRTARAGSAVRLKICHAGIVEWLVGIHAGGRAQAALYAGQRRAQGDLPDALEPARRLPHHGPWSPQVAALAPVDATQAQWIAELFAQLAARLTLWCEEQAPTAASSAPAPRSSRAASPPAPIVAVGDDRRARVRSFIHQNHFKDVGLPALAQHLGLSRTRVGHVVRELFGCSYLTLRDETRLRAAADMLRTTTLAVPAVAAACGFRDPSRFHRLFRRTHGTTPGAFRRNGGTVAEP